MQTDGCGGPSPYPAAVSSPHNYLPRQFDAATAAALESHASPHHRFDVIHQSRGMLIPSTTVLVLRMCRLVPAAISRLVVTSALILFLTTVNFAATSTAWSTSSARPSRSIAGSINQYPLQVHMIRAAELEGADDGDRLDGRRENNGILRRSQQSQHLLIHGDRRQIPETAVLQTNGGIDEPEGGNHGRDGDSITSDQVESVKLDAKRELGFSDLKTATRHRLKNMKLVSLADKVKSRQIDKEKVDRIDEEDVDPSATAAPGHRRRDRRDEVYGDQEGGKAKIRKLAEMMPITSELTSSPSAAAEDGAQSHNAKEQISASLHDGSSPQLSSVSHAGDGAGSVRSDENKDRDEHSKGAAAAAEQQQEVVVRVAEEREEEKELVSEFNLGRPVRDWDRKRRKWARAHPEVKQEELFILTGTQPWACTNPEGDHLLLRCFKNKVDYARIHGVGLFYNTALLDAHMPSFWAKLPVVRATMLAHPEVEWIWWLDADAIVTDMEFKVPLHRYGNYNMVVHGWESLVFEKRSWLGLNAGSFLLRNCQWSMDLLERWACMSPKAPMGDAYRHILSDLLPDRDRNPTDDQAALVYLLIKERHRWASKLRMELDFFLSGYWLELTESFEATEERYRRMEEEELNLMEMLEMEREDDEEALEGGRDGGVGKERLVAAMGRAREHRLRRSGVSVHERRPLITHFTGCQPCSGNHNGIYTKEQCHDGMVRALNYADDQVLRTLGYQHHALHVPDVRLLKRQPSFSAATSTSASSSSSSHVVV